MLAFRTTHFQIFSQQIKVNNARAANKRENSSVLTLKRDYRRLTSDWRNRWHLKKKKKNNQIFKYSWQIKSSCVTLARMTNHEALSIRVKLTKRWFDLIAVFSTWKVRPKPVLPFPALRIFRVMTTDKGGHWSYEPSQISATEYAEHSRDWRCGIIPLPSFSRG